MPLGKKHTRQDPRRPDYILFLRKNYPIAVVEANGVEIVLLEFAGKIEGPSFMSKLGLDARQKKFIVSKEGLNVFLTYKAVGAEILMVESAGFNRQSLRPSDYKKVPRPIFPLDPEAGWSLEAHGRRQA